MILKYDNLKPYQSYLLLELSKEKDNLGKVDRYLIDEIYELLIKSQKKSLDIEVKQTSHLKTQLGKTKIGFIHYLEKQPPTWSNTNEIKDIIHNLIVVARQNRLFAIYSSDKNVLKKILRSISKNDETIISYMNRINPGKLNAAFVNGKACTLWLSGTHRRVSVKADNKILSGVDLQYALDPLGDQSFYFTSVRCRPESTDSNIVQIGITPGQSKAWIGPSNVWGDFVEKTNALLKHLSNVSKSEEAPLPILSLPVKNIDGIEEAFDIAVMDPDLLPDNQDLPDELLTSLKKWSMEANYEVEGSVGPDFKVHVSLNNLDLGKFIFKLNKDLVPKIKFDVNIESSSDEEIEELRNDAKNILSNRNYLSVWYESGHTIKEGEVYSMRYRDMQFNDISWKPFPDIDVTKEKPIPINEIGEQDSLFCWMKNEYPTSGRDYWLATDDGAGEIADFIFFEPENDSILTLIHVKAAHSNSLNRKISVSCHEVVTGQAIKNLRFLDQKIVSDGLNAGIDRAVGNLVWHNNERSSRDEMIESIVNAGVNVRKKVVIVQPHIIQQCYNDARANMDSSDGKRLRQLDTLLLGVRASIQSVGAEFEVIMQE